MIDLGGLPDAQFSTSTTSIGFSPPISVSSASAINNWGQIVGVATANNGAIHAFLYSEGTMVDLNRLVKLTHANGPPGFLVLTEANGINDLGQIVGAGTFWDGRQQATRAFLLNLSHELLPSRDYFPPP
jgi:probable HAF family extracellular repeat protein